MFADVGTGGETYTAGSAKRRLTVAILETDAFTAESIDIFGRDFRVPIATEIVGSQLIRGNNKQIHIGKNV